MADPAGAATEAQLSEAQRTVLNVIWQHLVESGAWPRFVQLDRLLYKRFDIEARTTLRSFPPACSMA